MLAFRAVPSTATKRSQLSVSTSAQRGESENARLLLSATENMRIKWMRGPIPAPHPPHPSVRLQTRLESHHCCRRALLSQLHSTSLTPHRPRGSLRSSSPSRTTSTQICACSHRPCPGAGAGRGWRVGERVLGRNRIRRLIQ